MKNITVYIVLTLLICVCAGLGFSLIYLETLNPEIANVINEMIFVSYFGNIVPYSILGIGIGFPISLIAVLFSWLQFFLIIIGAVDPHLTSEGFIEALKTLTYGAGLLTA